MADINKLVKACRSKLKMRPSLPLGQPISLGAVGYLEDHAFRYLGTAEIMLGQPPGALISGTGTPEVAFSSGKEVSLSVHAKGQVSPTFGEIIDANGAIEVSLGSSNSYLIAAKDIAYSAMQDPVLLLRAMLERYSAGAWQKEYCFIYEIGTPASYTAMLSQQSGARVLLSADVAPGPAISVGDLGAGIGFKRQSGALDRLISDQRMPAFFNAYRVKERFFRAPAIKTATKIGPHASSAEVAAALGVTENPFELA